MTTNPDTKHLRALRVECDAAVQKYGAGHLVVPVATVAALCDAAEERDRLREQLEGVVRDTVEAARGIREALGRLDPMTDRYGKSLADAVRAVVAERDAAVASKEHTESFYAVRCERLRAWAREDMAHRRGYFAIMANGTLDTHEPPTYAQQLYLARHRAEKAEAERDAAVDALRMVRAIAADQRAMHEARGEGRDLAIVGRLEAIDAECTRVLKGGG